MNKKVLSSVYFKMATRHDPKPKLGPKLLGSLGLGSEFEFGFGFGYRVWDEFGFEFGFDSRISR